jgi:hypothetical protein
MMEISFERHGVICGPNRKKPQERETKSRFLLFVVNAYRFLD